MADATIKETETRPGEIVLIDHIRILRDRLQSELLSGNDSFQSVLKMAQDGPGNNPVIYSTKDLITDEEHLFLKNLDSDSFNKFDSIYQEFNDDLEHFRSRLSENIEYYKNVEILTHNLFTFLRLCKAEIRFDLKCHFWRSAMVDAHEELIHRFVQINLRTLLTHNGHTLIPSSMSEF